MGLSGAILLLLLSPLVVGEPVVPGKLCQGLVLFNWTPRGCVTKSSPVTPKLEIGGDDYDTFPLPPVSTTPFSAKMKSTEELKPTTTTTPGTITILPDPIGPPERDLHEQITCIVIIVVATVTLCLWALSYHWLHDLCTEEQEKMTAEVGHATPITSVSSHLLEDPPAYKF